MSRVTRSRKIDVVEDQSATPSTDVTTILPCTPLSELPSSNIMAPISDAIAAEVKGLKIAYKAAIGGGRKGPKRGRQKDEPIPPLQENNSDAIQHLPEPAPVPAKRTTRRQAAQAEAAERALSIADAGAPVEATANGIPILLDVITEHQEPSTQPSMHSSNPNVSNTVDKQHYDTVASLRSPVKKLEDIESPRAPERASSPTKDDEDSFICQIISRSPSKPVKRIEDSVEALDRLEDAIEALDAAALTEHIASPEKTRQSRPITIPLDALELHRLRVKSRDSSSGALRSRSQTPRLTQSPTRNESLVARPGVITKASSMTFKSVSSQDRLPQDSTPQARPGTGMRQRPVSMFVKATNPSHDSPLETSKKPTRPRPISLLPPKDVVRSSKPVTIATFELPGEAVARRLKEQREARTARREANEQKTQPTRAVSGPRFKSSKPLTVSNFELPGEALSRKKREAHEAKVKAQEEEERRRREFKAKPIRTSIVPDIVPRGTLTSRARNSRVGVEDASDCAHDVRNSTYNSVSSQRPSFAGAATANTSVPRSRVHTQRLERQPSSASIGSKISQRAVSASDVQIQRERGKIIYNRDAKQTEEIERERREREAAAKKAREDAAERGRQASREWAEKMMAKRMAAANAANAKLNG